MIQQILAGQFDSDTYEMTALHADHPVIPAWLIGIETQRQHPWRNTLVRSLTECLCLQYPLNFSEESGVRMGLQIIQIKRLTQGKFIFEVGWWSKHCKAISITGLPISFKRRSRRFLRQCGLLSMFTSHRIFSATQRIFLLSFRPINQLKGESYFLLKMVDERSMISSGLIN